MRPGEIFLAQFPFGDVPGMKLRPVLLLTGAVGPIPEVLVAYISSVIPAFLDPSMPEFSSTPLKVASMLRLHKVATIHNQASLGILEPLTRRPSPPSQAS